MSLAAPPEAVYPDVNTAIASIQEHAKAHGYAFYVYNTRPHRVVLACDRAGSTAQRAKTLIHTALNNDRVLALRSVGV
jgi:hypothetical protein